MRVLAGNSGGAGDSRTIDALRDFTGRSVPRGVSGALSPAEFISKLESAQQELDETDYWLELIVRAGLMPPAAVADLANEVRELIAIFAASARTAKDRR